MLLSGNWAAGIPNAATAATIDRTTPNATVTTTSGGTAQSVIGAAAGSPAVAPGTLNSASVAFGGGTGSLNFNHTSANYVFAPTISGNGTVNVLAGTTILTPTTHILAQPTSVAAP
jgi:fibronectin-binding autotransporter adhesin